MKIITWNVNGIRAVEKKGELDKAIKKFKPEILCLQETKARPEQLDLALKDKPGYISYFNWPKADCRLFIPDTLSLTTDLER